jgi:polyisoprenoid-binding protein YceI
VKRIALLAVAAVLSLPAFASAASWEIDPAHTTVGFSVKHMMVSNVKGQFKTTSGTVEFDPAAPEKAVIDVKIDVASVDTEIGKRDDHLKSPEFFDAAKFPQMTFKSKSVKKVSDGKYKVTGDLTIKGTKKEVTLDVEGLDKGFKNPFSGKEARGASATGKINRKDFGLTWNMAVEGGGIMVGEEIAIQIDVELIAK